MTEAAADRAERVAGYLHDTKGDAFLKDIESFARRRPLLAATGGFMIGLAASRFLKASAERRSLSANGEANGAQYDAPTHNRGLADPGSAAGSPAQHFGHAEGAV